VEPRISNMLGAGGKASSCNGKHPHTRASADKAALSMAQKHHEPFQAYKCQHCDFWHIGHALSWRHAAPRENVKKKAGART